MPGALESLIPQVGGDANQGRDEVSAILSQLLGTYDPGERNAAIQRNREAMDAYQQQLDKPLPDQGAISRMANGYLQRYGARPNTDFANFAGAVGAEGDAAQQLALDNLTRQDKARAFQVDRAQKDLSEADAFAKNLFGVLKSRAGGSGSDTIIKMDNNGNMVEYDKNSRVTRVVYSNQQQEYAKVWQKAYEAAVANSMKDPEQYAHTVAMQVLGNVAPETTEGTAFKVSPQAQSTLPGGATVPGTPQKTATGASDVPLAPAPQAPTPAPAGGKNPLVYGTIPGTKVTGQLSLEDRLAILKDQRKDPNASATSRIQLEEAISEIERKLGVKPGKPVNSSGMGSDTIQYKNKEREAGAIEGNKEMANSYVKDYTAVRDEAAAAGNALQTYDNLSKIKPNTNMFADKGEQIGRLLDAFGVDSKSPVIQNAIKTRQSNLLLDQLRNEALRGEKGVQTRTDEVRIANEFPKTGDVGKVWDYGTRLLRERALRKQERLKYFDGVANDPANSGVPVQARAKFDREYAEDPLTQLYGGKLIFRSDYIRGFMKANPDASESDAVESWRDKERAFKSRGGK